MFEQDVTIHFNAQDKGPIEGKAIFKDTRYFGGGCRLYSLKYEVEKGVTLERKFGWNAQGDPDWFKDINSIILDGRFHGRSELCDLVAEIQIVKKSWTTGKEY